MLLEDTPIPDQGERPGEPTGIASKRWVTIRPPNAPPHAATILLARAATPHQATRIGDQTGGRVAFFLHTDDFARDHARFTAAGVGWIRLGARPCPARAAPLRPTDQPYGRVAVFADLYGNLWDLIGPPPQPAQ